ncbi:hypothetical protein J2Y41_000896 [Arthrobacter sp. 1088]|uniref:peptidase M56 family protein n=1 Tax=Arthrobacter sp. 1088 TaxID=2817768 RepID=UPI002858BC7D|nr:peptidase M56 family protein [Arthrobacter sp. 1088]MDR6685343.1 hypothetical protein [Arthrobacter sp. 1088]
MSPVKVDDRFSDALRAELVRLADGTSPARRRKGRVWVGTAALAGIGALSGISASAAGLFEVPGTEKVTTLAPEISETYTGTATLDLGTPPQGTTAIEIELSCLTAGRFEFQDGASSMCSDADASSTPGNWSRYTLKIAPGQHEVTIKTEPDSRWKVTARYVNQIRTELGVNDRGDTFGVESQENGTPDLIAVLATNGSHGYVYSRDLYNGKMPGSPEEAAKNEPMPPREIPVYLSDGMTIVGTFDAPWFGGGIPSYPTPAPQ